VLIDKFDVVVVGGGPSGAFAAYELAKKSLKVALIEKEQLPRYKACGGVVAPHIEKIIDFSITPAIERRISKMRVTVNLNAPFISESPRPFAYMVMRDTFDNYLVEIAQKAGVQIYQKSPLSGLEETQNGYIITIPQGEIGTRYVIGADGANSTTRKFVGAPRFKRLSVAIEREIQSTPEYLEKWQDTIALDFGYMRSGYAWVFPKAKNFSVGVVGPKSIAKQFNPYYDATVNYYKDEIGNAKPYITAGHHLPIRIPNERIVFGKTLLIGDAAGLIEPMAGEGIYYAMKSGQLAAETIFEATKSGNNQLLAYQKKIDLEIQPELQVAKSLLYLLNLAPRFWVPRLLKQSHSFWKYFYRIFTGEKEYQDLPKKIGPLGQIFFSLLANDNSKLYNELSE